MSRLLIKNGMVVNSEKTVYSDVLIENEKITEIAPQIDIKNIEIIDAKGMYVLPGGIDVHTHLELPQMGTISSDTFYTGSVAALHGGTTTIIDFANQVRGESLQTTLNKSLAQAKGNCVCDYSFHLAITDVNSSTLGEISQIVKQGVTSFKTFMAYDNLQLSDSDLRLILQETKKHGALVTVHAEIGSEIKRLIAEKVANNQLEVFNHPLVHPATCEADAVARMLELAKLEDSQVYFVHISAENSLEHIARARALGQKVFVETCIQYLLLDESLYQADFFDACKYVMSPPLRAKNDQMAIWKGIVSNEVDVVATDHCPFLLNQKEAGKSNFTKIPNGAPGIENRFELLYSEGVAKKRISINKFVDIACTMPAKIFGMYPRKGTISIGADADIVIFDPNTTHTVSAKNQHMNVDYSSYEGMLVQGKCKQVILRGQVAIENNLCKLFAGAGTFIKRV